MAGEIPQGNVWTHSDRNTVLDTRDYWLVQRMSPKWWEIIDGMQSEYVNDGWQFKHLLFRDRQTGFALVFTHPDRDQTFRMGGSFTYVNEEFLKKGFGGPGTSEKRVQLDYQPIDKILKGTNLFATHLLAGPNILSAHRMKLFGSKPVGRAYYMQLGAAYLEVDVGNLLTQQNQVKSAIEGTEAELGRLRVELAEIESGIVDNPVNLFIYPGQSG